MPALVNIIGGEYTIARLYARPLKDGWKYRNDGRLVLAHSESEPALPVVGPGADLEITDADRALDALIPDSATQLYDMTTAIEAVLKADGRGLMVPPDEVRLLPGGRAFGPDGTAYLVLPVVAAPGMVVSLALRS